MTPRIVSVVMTATVLLAAASAWAHHNLVSLYEWEKPNTVLIGTLTRIDWRNPHVGISMEVNGDGNEAQTWNLETNQVLQLKKLGITRELLENALGQSVRIEISFARNGARNGYAWNIMLSDGTSVILRPAE
jgi:Family of unknown function (DUF6152)